MRLYLGHDDRENSFLNHKLRDKSIDVSIRVVKLWVRDEVLEASVIASRIVLIRAARLSVMWAVSAWSLVATSFFRIVSVEERHWFNVSGDVANDPKNFSISLNSLSRSAVNPTKYALKMTSTSNLETMDCNR